MKKIFKIVLVFSLFVSCSKEHDDIDNHPSKQMEEFQLNKELSSFSKEDQLKIVVSQALGKLMNEDKEFNSFMFNQLIDKNGKIKEFYYLQYAKETSFKTKSVHQHFLDCFKKGTLERSLIDDFEEILPNLAIKIPDWVQIALDNEPIENLDWGIYPCVIDKRTIAFSKGKVYKKVSNSQSTLISTYLPIQVEESESVIPVNKNDNSTIWFDDLVENHFPSLKNCSNFSRADYVSFSSVDYDFVDKHSLNNAIRAGVICALPLEGGNTSPDDCSIVYERDCRDEKNVIEGIRMANYNAYLGMNNQPGGEDILKLHYTFVVASMCGDLNQSQVCPPSKWEFVFFASMTDFFEMQLFYGDPSSLQDVIYDGPFFYIKCLPKYYDIPTDLSQSGLYSQAKYLSLTNNASWDGNAYGDAISLSIHEHDDVEVSQSTSYSNEITNTTKISLSLKLSENFNVGTDFSNSVTRSSTFQQTLIAEKDVELGTLILNYYDVNYVNSPLFGYGINHSTGSVNTHFAFYY